MKIILAKDAGYCFGVRDAVNMAYDAADKYGDVYMLGDIVHNENVVKDLSKAGAKVVDDLNDIPKNKPVMFRAHGTKTALWDEAKRLNLKVIDATCPLVHEIHDEVKMLAAEGRRIIIIGDHGHDEVMAIADQIDKPIILSNIDEANNLSKAGLKKVGIVSQSTQMIENVQAIINILMTKSFDIRFVNTICFPTKRNHHQIKELAVNCDVMIIVGSFTSANSKRLTELAKERNKFSYQVQTSRDLNAKWFDSCSVVGISAGASTPDYLIDNVIKAIKEIDSKNV